MDLTALSLFSGVGMLDIGASIGAEYLGWTVRTLGYCERDAYAASIILARMEQEALEPAPVFVGDLSDLDGSEFRGAVDIITAGPPCQPYSAAGKKRGNIDRRSYGDGDGPLFHFGRIISECCPAMVFIENVPTWIRGGFFRTFGEELCRMGYRIESPVFLAASDVGASHKRERCFILAHRISGTTRAELKAVADQDRGTVDAGKLRSTSLRRGDGGALPTGTETGSGVMAEPMGNPNGPRTDPRPEGSRPRKTTSKSGESMADPERSSGREQIPQRRSAGGGTSRGTGGELGNPDGNRGGQSTQPAAGWRSNANAPDEALADTDKPRPQGERPAEQARRGGFGATSGIFAPGPKSPAWLGIMAAEPWRAPAIKPGFRMLVDGLAATLDASRADQLRCAGNGVVPLQAAVAFVELARRAGLDQQKNPPG